MKIDYKNIYYPPGGILLWILIFLELITFGVALIVLVAGAHNNIEAYKDSASHLNATYGAINTVFLLTSGFFMATSVRLFKKRNIKKSDLYLKLTMLFGVFFLILKSMEYSEKLEKGLVLGHDTFLNFYWLLTGFHVIHVLVGLVILLILHFTMKNPKALTEDFEASATFWHMCDLIWLLLFPVLYLIF